MSSVLALPHQSLPSLFHTRSYNHSVELATSSAARTLTERDRLQASYSASVWKHREPSNNEATDKYICFGDEGTLIQTVCLRLFTGRAFFFSLKTGSANRDFSKNMIKGQKWRKLAVVVLLFAPHKRKTHLRCLDEEFGGRHSFPSDCWAWRARRPPSPGTSRLSRKHLCPHRGPAFKKGSVTSR